MTKTEEKRRYDRVRFRTPVQVFPIIPSHSGNIYEVQNHFFEAMAFNINAGGLGLEIKETLDPDTILKMSFEIGEEEEVSVFGKVVWSKMNFCGVRFLFWNKAFRKNIRSMGKKDSTSR